METETTLFKNYLQSVGYSQSAMVQYSSFAQDLLNYLKKENKRLEQINSTDIENYWSLLVIRPCKRADGALSPAYLNSHLNGLKAFGNYCRLLKGIELVVEIRHQKSPLNIQLVVLSPSEIQSLYKAADSHFLVYQLRDRVMLGMLYGCGLRKSEAAHLNVSDIDLLKGLVCVQKGKGGKKRYVPMSIGVKTDVARYLQESRPKLVRTTKEASFLVSQHGERIHSFYYRIDVLCKKAGITKAVRTHTFRHSIATHLMEEGMSIEHIARFLGHSSLDSTQIYTHIVHGKSGI